MGESTKNHFIIYGDSHVIAILGWWQALRSRFGSPNCSLEVRRYYESVETDEDFTVTYNNGLTVLHPWVRDDLNQLGLDPLQKFFVEAGEVKSWLLLQLGGTAQACHVAIDWEGDFEIPNARGAARHLESPLIPYDIIRDRVVQRLGPIIRGLEMVAAIGTERVAVLAPPPPHRREESFQSWINGADRQVTKAHIRLKFYQVYCDVMRAACDRLGLLFHDASALATDEDGFLRSEFEHDGVHASAEYGGLFFLSFFQRVMHGAELHCEGPLDELAVAMLGMTEDGGDPEFAHKDTNRDARITRADRLNVIDEMTAKENRFESEKLHLQDRVNMLAGALELKDEIIEEQERRYERAQNQIAALMRQLLDADRERPSMPPAA